MKFLPLLTAVSILVASNAWAGELEDGNAAIDRKDYVTALDKFKSAAAKNAPNAQYNLGLMYDNGLGVAQDYAEAMRWYKLAAAQGHADAQSNLGVMYAKGQGIAQDYTRAHMWFNLAAAKGNADAVNNRDKAATVMTQQQIAEAQKLARECQARNYKKCD